jgi:DsbC/DsbD-like thiol-disulfide interchange protein
MLTPRIGIALALLGLWASPAAADPPHARVQLLADVATIAPGRPFMLGVQFSIDPTWHVYWKNPGDAGMATRVKFNLPDGFTVGPLLFPTPQRLEQPGNIVVLGYEDSVLLLAQVTPPARLPEGFMGDFSADISWLVCADVCIPGKATASLSLASSVSAAPANSQLFDAARAQLPVDAAQCEDIATLKTENSDAGSGLFRVRIEVTWKHGIPDGVQFIPGSFDDYNISNTQVESNGDKTLITVDFRPLAGKSPQSEQNQCVIGYKDKEGNRRGVNVMVALPRADSHP